MGDESETHVAYDRVGWGEVVKGEGSSVDGTLAVDSNCLCDAVVAECVTAGASSARINKR